MLINIQTYLHFGSQTKFHAQKEFTKIKKKMNIQKEQDKWMQNNCTFSYRQLFEASAGEMMEPIMFFTDIVPTEIGSTDSFDGWCGGKYEYEIYDIKESDDTKDVIDSGRYIVVKPHPDKVSSGVKMDMDEDGIYNCNVYVFKDMEIQFIFNIFGVAVMSYTDGSKMLVLGEYKIDDKFNIFNEWYPYDFKYGAQESGETEAEIAENEIEDWNLILGTLPVPTKEKSKDEEDVD